MHPLKQVVPHVIGGSLVALSCAAIPPALAADGPGSPPPGSQQAAPSGHAADEDHPGTVARRLAQAGRRARRGREKDRPLGGPPPAGPPEGAGAPEGRGGGAGIPPGHEAPAGEERAPGGSAGGAALGQAHQNPVSSLFTYPFGVTTA